MIAPKSYLLIIAVRNILFFSESWDTEELQTSAHKLFRIPAFE
jgi:hypothetical protein